MEDIMAVKNALESENKSLKEILKQFQANKKALEDTIQELMAANINQRATFLLNQQAIETQKAEIEKLKEEVKKLTPEEVSVDLDAA